jgi:guanylate kinase
LETKQGQLFIISSVAGGGKTTLINMLLAKHSFLHFSISYTSRNMRRDEVQDKNYHFVTKTEFEALIQQDAFLEWEVVHNNYYGTPKKETLFRIQNGNTLLLDIDVKGARKVKAAIPDSVSIFILPPNEEVWKQRLIDRKTESEESLSVRLANGKKELEYADEFDHQIVNDRLEIAFQNLESILSSYFV